jgi:hypothetical protein
VRKHFVRHHEAWLTQAGCNVDIWRKSCAPIGKTLGAARGGSKNGANAFAAAANTAAAAAAGGGSGLGPGGGGSSGDLAAVAAAAAAAAMSEDDTLAETESSIKGSGRQGSRRLADGAGLLPTCVPDACMTP